MQLTVKFYIGDEIRRLTLQDNCSYAFLRTTLSNLCTLPRDFLIKYKDEEGDMVSITSDIEFQAAKALATEPILRLWICGDLKEKKIGNDVCFMEQVKSSPVVQAANEMAQQAAQQLLPIAQAGQQAAQQAAQQFIPFAQQFGQQIYPYVQAAQQVAQEQLYPLAQQAAKQFMPFAQEVAKQVQQAVQPPAKAPVVSTSRNQVVESQPVPESTPTSVQVSSDVASERPAYYKQWDYQLNLLKDMGFCQEEDHLVHLLEQYEGQTERVIEALF